MRRALVVACLAVATVTSCGALAEDAAGTVAGDPVSAGTVDALARDETLAQITQRQAAETESVLPAGDARSALILAMQSVVIRQLVAEAGIEVDLEDPTPLDEQLAQTEFSSQDLHEVTRDVLLEQIAGFGALTSWISELDLTDPDRARALYDLEPDAWDRRCVVVAEATGEPELVEGLVAGASGLAELAEASELLEVVTEAGSCLPNAQILAMFPPSLAGAVLGAEPGEPSGPHEVQGSTLWFEVTSDEPGSPETMLEALGDQSFQFDPSLLVVLRMLSDSTVNPRYGTEVELTDNLSIGRPEAPPTSVVLDLDNLVGGEAGTP